MLLYRACLAFGLALVVNAPLVAATYHVAQLNPQANDTGTGTPDRPWKTITKAAEKVTAGDVVTIHGGAYRERVIVKTSGTADAPVRFVAAPGEYVVVTGADRLTGWRRVDAA